MDQLRNPKTLGAAAAVLVVGVIAVILLRGDDLPLPGSAPEGSPSPTPEHAAWAVRVVPAGAGQPSDRRRRAVARQEENVSAVAAAVNDALILGEGDLADMEGSVVTQDAARALARSPLALGEEIVDVVAQRRRARIGVDIQGANRAVATAVVVARVETADGRSRVRYETTLWMERVQRGWRVFAFDGRRRRA